MKINAKVRYGIRVLLELTLNKTTEGIYQKDISRNQDISFKYLDQIIAGLKSSGLVVNAAGKKSGYRLNREPDTITVFDIFNAFNPEFAVVDCLTGENKCQKSKSCATREFWEGLNTSIISYLKSTTIHDLTNRQIELDQQEEEITYQI
jgi:Rrf2 family protein